jgi:hypothetical protein
MHSLRARLAYVSDADVRTGTLFTPFTHTALCVKVAADSSTLRDKADLSAAGSVRIADESRRE